MSRRRKGPYDDRPRCPSTYSWRRCRLASDHAGRHEWWNATASFDWAASPRQAVLGEQPR